MGKAKRGPQPAQLVQAMASPSMDFTTLTRRHGVRVVSDARVEECSLAIGEIVGHGNIAAASRMNKAIVIFFNSVAAANTAVQNGVVLNGTLHQVLPLSLPSKKVVISNVPPFLPNDLLERELSRHGKLVSPITKISLGCKSPLLRHVVSFRRQVYMIPNDGIELDLSLTFKFDGSNYTVFVTSDTVMKCFGCGGMGHLIRACPSRPTQNEGDSVTLSAAEGGEPTDGVAPAVEPGDSLPAAEPSVGAAPPLETMEPALLDSSEIAASSTEPAGPPMPTTACSEWVEFVAVESATPKPVDAATTEPPSRPDQPDVGNTDASLLPGESEPCEASTASGASPSGKPNVTCIADLSDKASVKHGASQAVSDGSDMEAEDSGFKKPVVKRKSSASGGCDTKKQAKDNVKTDVGTESDGYTTDSSMSWSFDENSVVMYAAEDISNFLKETKGQKNVRVENYFIDGQQFINDVCHHRREGAFTDRELYRLKKFVSKLKKQFNEKA